MSEASILAQRLGAQSDATALIERVREGILPLAFLSGGEVALLMPVPQQEAFAVLAWVGGEGGECPEEIGKMLPFASEPTALKALRTRKFQQAPYGARKGGELVHHAAAPVRQGKQIVAVLSFDVPLLSRKETGIGRQEKLWLSALSRLLFGDALSEWFCVDLLGGSGQLSVTSSQLPVTSELVAYGDRWRLSEGDVDGQRMIWLEAQLEGGALVLSRPLSAKPFTIGGYSLIRSELHHRLKNNLQTVVSLLRMQARRLAQPEAQAALNDAAQRVLSIATVHELLARTFAEKVRLRELTQKILQHAAERFQDDQELKVQTAVIGPEIELTAKQASVLAPALNELVENCFKHAFKDRDGGSITVAIGTHDGHVKVEVADDGCGCPSQPANQPTNQQSLGLFIVRNLVQNDLKGEFVWESKPGGGTKATILFRSN